MCLNDLLAFGGGGNFAISLDGDLLSGSSGSCDTFGNEYLAYDPNFELKNVEGEDLDLAYDSILAFSARGDIQEPVFWVEEGLKEIRCGRMNQVKATRGNSMNKIKSCQFNLLIYFYYIVFFITLFSVSLLGYFW